MNMTSFLFEEDDEKHLSLTGIDLDSPVAKAFAQLGGDDMAFPTLTSDGLKVSSNCSVFCSFADLPSSLPIRLP